MNQQQRQVKVDLSKTTPWSCDECGHEVFGAGLLLCGHVNKDFYPPELAEKDEKNEE